MDVRRVLGGQTSRLLLLEPIAAFAAIVIAANVSAAGVPGLDYVLAVGTLIAFGLAPWWWKPKLQSAHTQIAAQAGQVELVTGRKRQVVRAADVRGACVAAHDGASTLSLTLASSLGRSFSLIGLSDEEIAACRRALGIYKDGVGFLAFPLGAPSRRLAWMLRVLSATAFSLSILTVSRPYVPGGTNGVLYGLAGVGFMLGAFTALGAYALFRRPKHSNTLLSLDASGIAFAGTFIAYRAIAKVEIQGSALRITAANGHVQLVQLGYLSDAEREVVVSQLQSACARARGNVARTANEEMELSRMERNPGESVGAWLERLDSVAVGGEGYRGSGLREADLKHLLDDPDGEPLMRAAAGRILVRLSPTYQSAVAALPDLAHDPRHALRIRVVTSNHQLTNAAAEELFGDGSDQGHGLSAHRPMRRRMH